MEKTIIELYSESDLALLRRRCRLWIAAAVLIGAAALCCCVFNCIKVRPSTANELLVKTICVSVIGGWAVISLVHFVILDIMYMIRHTEAMMSADREAVSGTFYVSPETLHIKKGIAIRNVTVGENDDVGSVMIASVKAERFSKMITNTVYCVHGFIVACEVENEAD